MVHNIYIPRLSESMVEGKITVWNVTDGEWIEKGRVVLVIETEKVTFDLEAPASGFLRILAQAGEAIPVGEIIGLLAETKKELEELQIRRAEAAFPKSDGGNLRVEENLDLSGKSEKAKISPLARKRAEEHKIELANIRGSGPGGRIVNADIEKAIKEKSARASPLFGVPFEEKKVKATIPLTGMRQAIAEHMHRSLSVSAQLTRMGEMDMTELVRLRKEILERQKSIGIRVTYTDLLVFILAKALRAFPILNSSLIGNEIKVWENVNIAVAVALEGEKFESGLIVPVIRDADEKSLQEISEVLKELTHKAREGKLLPKDVSGGTFTLTNIGVFSSGWSLGTPIINQPQVAILQTSAIIDRPVAVNGQLAVRPIMAYSLTYDHRVIDGAVAARFTEKIKELIETPNLLIL